MSSICVGFFTPVHSVDPHHAQDYAAGQIIEQLYDPPYRQDPSSRELQPMVFTDRLVHERVGGRTRLAGRVRPDLRFSDGSPVTADDVVSSLRRAGPVATRARIETQGREVVFWLEEDDPRFEEALARRWCSVVARRGDKLVGTGPFVVREGWTPEHIVLERNPHARRPAGVDQIEFRIFPPAKDGNPEDLINAVDDGTVDFTTALGRDHVGKLSGVRKMFQPGSSTALLAFNFDHPLLAKVEVRRAICEAIDRTSLASLSYVNPHAFVARSVLPPYMWRKTDGIRPDRQRARERLARVGVNLDRPLKLITMWGPRPYLPQPARTARAVADQLAAVGLPCQVVTTRDSVDYTERTEAGRYDLDLTGWIADTPDPYDFLAATFASDAIPRAGEPNSSANNMSRYRSRAMDEALLAYRKEGSEERLQACMDLVVEDAPCNPLFHGPTIIVHSWRLRNVSVSEIGIPDFASVQLD